MVAVWSAMTVFALAMSISPGPVNMVIVVSGAQHGIRRTLPFVSGATIGFTLLLALVGFGLMQVFSAQPWLLDLLGWAGAAFIVYIGYRIATAAPGFGVEQAAAPRFWQGFLLQWLNPKAWVACAAGAAMFSRPDSVLPLVTFIAIYFVVCYASLAAWAVLGNRVGLWLDNALRWRLFNATMGALLGASALYMVLI